MGNSITVKTSAKINLALDVTGKLPNGYHNIESIFQTVGMYDEITVELTDGGIQISCDVPEKFASADTIPCDSRNIAYKAADRFITENALECGCKIHIKKGIPSQAGMGGGSTDAAAVLYCLGKLTGKPFSSPEKLGADVPFFLTGGTAFVEGIGERITPVSDYSGRILVIAKGNEGVSTAEAYSKIDALVNPHHPDVKNLLNSIENNDGNEYRFFGNLFEDAIHLESVNHIEAVMSDFGSLSPCMTGSGSAVFGLFKNEKDAEACAEKLESEGYFAKVCHTVKESFIIL